MQTESFIARALRGSAMQQRFRDQRQVSGIKDSAWLHCQLQEILVLVVDERTVNKCRS
jgi:hypothetical protein